MKNNLTVAICAYNCENYIALTLDSLMKQTFNNFDLIIVNDCSTDRTAEVINKYFEKNPRQYQLHHFKENQGLCGGRVWVEHNVQTKYLMFMDADDILYPTYVETLYKKITSDSDIMAVGCYVEYINSAGKKIGGGIFLGETTKEGFYKKAANNKLIFSIATSMYNREIALRVGGHNNIGFPEGKIRYQDFCEDLDLWTRMSDLYKEGKAIVVIPQILYQYRKHTSVVSANTYGMLLRMRQIKTNLLRRRNGEKDLTFIEFSQSLSDVELKKIKIHSKSVDELRKGAFLIQKGCIFNGCISIAKSIYYNPSYIIDKIKHNLLRIK